MKKFILLLVIVAAAFAVWNRQRLYFRDPLANVARDGTKEEGAQVYINYSNDVLLQNDNAPMYILLVQHEQRIGMPPVLKCVHYIVCMTDSNQATLVSVNEGVQVESMSGKTVAFKDAAGHKAVITLH